MIEQIYLQLDNCGLKYRKKRNLAARSTEELTLHIKRLKRLAARAVITIDWIHIHHHQNVSS